MKHFRRIPIAALTILVASCGGDSPSEPIPDPKPNVTGTWQGAVSGATMRLTMNHDTLSNAVTGSGNITGGDTGIAISASGNYAGSTLSLTLSSQGFEPMNFTGTHSSTAITGTLNGSGFSNDAVTLTKQ